MDHFFEANGITLYKYVLRDVFHKPRRHMNLEDLDGSEFADFAQ